VLERNQTQQHQITMKRPSLKDQFGESESSVDDQIRGSDSRGPLGERQGHRNQACETIERDEAEKTPAVGSGCDRLRLLGPELPEAEQPYQGCKGEDGKPDPPDRREYRKGSESASERIEESSERASEAVHEAAEKASDKAEEAGEKVSDKAEEAGEKASEKAEEAGEKASDKAEEAGEKASDKAEESGEEVVERMVKGDKKTSDETDSDDSDDSDSSEK